MLVSGHTFIPMKLIQTKPEASYHAQREVLFLCIESATVRSVDLHLIFSSLHQVMYKFLLFADELIIERH